MGKFFLLNIILSLVVLNGVSGAKEQKGSLLLISMGLGSGLIDFEVDFVHHEELKNLGYQIATTKYNQLTWDFMKQFNAIVLIDCPRVGKDENTWPKDTENVRGLLYRYLEEGGGVLVMVSPDQDLGAKIIGANIFLKPFDIEILNEQIIDPTRNFKREDIRGTYAWTTAVSPSPITENVARIWYPTHVECIGDLTAYTIKAGEEWKVVVKGMETAHTRRALTAKSELEDKVATYSSAPPMIAYRTYNKGRLVIFPVYSTFTVLSGNHPYWDGIVMRKGDGKNPSDVTRLLLNSYEWLTEPSLKSGLLGGYIPPKQEVKKEEPTFFDWEKAIAPRPSAPGFTYKGIIGIHSNLSDGKGEAEEYALYARLAGYDFVCFTENYSLMDERKWKILKERCKKISSQGILALPGLEFKDAVGNDFVVYTDIAWPNPEWNNPKNRYGLNTAIYYYAEQWPALAVFNSKKNPNRPWFIPNYPSFAVYTYRDNKLIDDSLDEYLILQRNTFGLFPIVVHQIYNPEEISKVKDNYQVYITKKFIKDIPGEISGRSGRYKSGYSVYISNGPKITGWGMINQTSNQKLKGADRWRLCLSVSSDVELKEVKIMDGVNIFRRFLPDDKVFTAEIDGYHDKQYEFMLVATDKSGNSAVSSVIQTTGTARWLQNCSDNQNIMTGGQGKPKKQKIEEKKKGYTSWQPQGIEVYSVSDKNINNDSRISVFEKEKGEIQVNYPHHEVLSMCSQDILIYDSYNQYTYPKWAEVGGGRPCAPLTPIEAYETQTRSYNYTGDGGYSEITVKFKKDLTLSSHSPNIQIYRIAGGPGGKFLYDHIVYVSNNGSVIDKEFIPGSGVTFSGKLSMGGYVCFYNSGAKSGHGIISLQDNLDFWIGAVEGWINICVGSFVSEVKNGTKLEFKIRSFNGLYPDDFEKFLNRIGFRGETLYKVKPEQGKIDNTQNVLALSAKDYGFSGKFNKGNYEGYLPMIINGLNENWDAGIWKEGGNEIFQRFGIKEGKGYAELELDDSEKNIFLGNYLISDKLEVCLTLIKIAEKNCEFVIHNPTDKDLVCTVKPNPGFKLIPSFSKKQEVKAGSSIKATVDF